MLHPRQAAKEPARSFEMALLHRTCVSVHAVRMCASKCDCRRSLWGILS